MRAKYINPESIAYLKELADNLTQMNELGLNLRDEKELAELMKAFLKRFDIGIAQITYEIEIGGYKNQPAYGGNVETPIRIVIGKNGDTALTRFPEVQQ